jgi:mitochondrial fission protein ELM1
MTSAKPSAWIVTDGKAGDEAPCIGIAEALGLEPSLRRVAPRIPWVWAMPWGPVDPREAASRTGSPVAAPFPDLLIAAGRRSVAYLRHVRRRSGGKTFTLMIRDPRTGPGTADLLWVPEHDALRGPNVLVTPTSPHRVSSERLAAARRAPPAVLSMISAPRVAVLLGGDSRHHRFTPKDMAHLISQLTALTERGFALMVTASRRTPQNLRDQVFQLARQTRGYAWDGTGDNPYISMLALADLIVATADSTNMIGEAAATGTGIYVFEPSGGHVKITSLLDRLRGLGITRRLEGELEPFSYSPVDSTPMIADAVRKALAARGVMI